MGSSWSWYSKLNPRWSTSTHALTQTLSTCGRRLQTRAMDCGWAALARTTVTLVNSPRSTCGRGGRRAGGTANGAGARPTRDGGGARATRNEGGARARRKGRRAIAANKQTGIGRLGGARAEPPTKSDRGAAAASAALTILNKTHRGAAAASTALTTLNKTRVTEDSGRGRKGHAARSRGMQSR